MSSRLAEETGKKLPKLKTRDKRLDDREITEDEGTDRLISSRSVRDDEP